MRGLQLSDRMAWHFYLYALLVKTPVGTIALFALVCAVGLCRAAARVAAVRREGQRDRRAEDRGSTYKPEAPASASLTPEDRGTAEQTAHLPVSPSPSLSSLPSPSLTLFRAVFRAVPFLLLAASIASSIAALPHSLSYFNEPAGGPENGAAHLLDANIDWGQDHNLRTTPFPCQPTTCVDSPASCNKVVAF